MINLFKIFWHLCCFVSRKDWWHHLQNARRKFKIVLSALGFETPELKVKQNSKAGRFWHFWASVLQQTSYIQVNIVHLGSKVIFTSSFLPLTEVIFSHTKHLGNNNCRKKTWAVIAAQHQRDREFVGSNPTVCWGSFSTLSVVCLWTGSSRKCITTDFIH